MPELGGQGGHWPPQYLAGKLTLFQTGGQIIPTYHYWHPQCFSPSGITDVKIDHALTSGMLKKVFS